MQLTDTISIASILYSYLHGNFVHSFDMIVGNFQCSSHPMCFHTIDICVNIIRA